MPRIYRDPSANSLIVFEAAARHANFTRAARELRISQPAVSHTVRDLEERLGVVLFERRHRGVQLTAPGRELMDKVALGLELIYQGVREVQALGGPRHQVTLAVSTATATYWLLPRVARFKQAYPEIELRCVTTDTDPDLGRESIDLAIPLGAGSWPRCHHWHFVDEEIFPVCSPVYLERYGSIENPEALPGATLLHLEERYRPRFDWSGWLARFGVVLPRGPRLFSFTDYSIVIRAALEGQGVALGWRHIVASLLAEGRLLRPMPQSVLTERPLRIVAPRTRPLSPAAARLRDWLIREATEESEVPPAARVRDPAE